MAFQDANTIYQNPPVSGYDRPEGCRPQAEWKGGGKFEGEDVSRGGCLCKNLNPQANLNNSTPYGFSNSCLSRFFWRRLRGAVMSWVGTFYTGPHLTHVCYQWGLYSHTKAEQNPVRLGTEGRHIHAGKKLPGLNKEGHQPRGAAVTGWLLQHLEPKKNRAGRDIWGSFSPIFPLEAGSS